MISVRVDFEAPVTDKTLNAEDEETTSPLKSLCKGILYIHPIVLFFISGGKKRTESTHIYNITLAASSLPQPRRPCHTLG